MASSRVCFEAAVVLNQILFLAVFISFLRQNSRTSRRKINKLWCFRNKNETAETLEEKYTEKEKYETIGSAPRNGSEWGMGQVEGNDLRRRSSIASEEVALDPTGC
jgi:hypothetical protein